MRSIQIDDDIYEHLLQNTQEIGESASSILRRLLKISPRTEPKADLSPSTEDLAMPAQRDRSKVAPILPTEQHAKLELLLNRLDLSSHRTAVDRFLAILGALHQLHQDKFRRVLTLGGRNRTYFAESEREILQHGSSTMPKLIEGTPYYVVTNNDTPKKQRMLEEVLRLLDYEYAEARSIARLVDPIARVPSFTRNSGTQRREDPEDALKI